MIFCPECNGKMQNFGNLSGLVYTSLPLQWDETWACTICKTKYIQRVYGSFDHLSFGDYRLVEPKVS